MRLALFAVVVVLSSLLCGVLGNHFFGGGLTWKTNTIGHNQVILTWRQIFWSNLQVHETARTARIIWGDDGANYTSLANLKFIGHITTIDRVIYDVYEVTLTHTYPLPGIYTVHLEGDTRTRKPHNVGGGRWKSSFNIRVNGEQFFAPPHYNMFGSVPASSLIVQLTYDSTNQEFSADLTEQIIPAVGISWPVECYLFTAEEVDILGRLVNHVPQLVTPSVIMTSDYTHILTITPDCVVHWPGSLEDFAAYTGFHFALPVRFTSPRWFTESVFELPMQLAVSV